MVGPGPLTRGLDTPETATFSPRDPSSGGHGEPRAGPPDHRHRPGARDRDVHGAPGARDPSYSRRCEYPPCRPDGDWQDGGGVAPDPRPNPERETGTDVLLVHHPSSRPESRHAPPDDLLRGPPRRPSRGPSRGHDAPGARSDHPAPAGRAHHDAG